MTKQIPVHSSAFADDPDTDVTAPEIAADLAYLRIVFVNVVFYGPRGAGDRNWVLIDPA